MNISMPEEATCVSDLVSWYEEAYQCLFSISRFWPCCAGDALRIDQDEYYVPLEQVGAGGYIKCRRDLDLWCYLANSGNIEQAASDALATNLDAEWVNRALWRVVEKDDDALVGIYDMADDIAGDLGWVEFRLDDLAEDVPELFEERFYRLLEDRDPALAARARKLVAGGGEGDAR